MESEKFPVLPRKSLSGKLLQGLFPSIPGDGQTAVLPTRHPDLRKIILQHEFQNQLRILSIGLLFVYSLALDFGRVSEICGNCCGTGIGLVQARTRIMNQLQAIALNEGPAL
jgi:hypothetical protein